MKIRVILYAGSNLTTTLTSMLSGTGAASYIDSIVVNVNNGPYDTYGGSQSDIKSGIDYVHTITQALRCLGMWIAVGCL